MEALRSLVRSTELSPKTLTLTPIFFQAAAQWRSGKMPSQHET
jgi:hypothetical protein